MNSNLNTVIFEKKLRESITGDVCFDQATKIAYSVDASIFEVEPLGVVSPKNQDEVLIILKIASEYGVSVIPRGAATGITGGCIGPGLIIDLSRHLNAILEINFDEEYVICEPGVVQDHLNKVLAKEGYRLGPDTSTGNRATLGGMLANNAAGARSLRYGKMVDHIQGVNLALANAETVRLGPLDERNLDQQLKQPTTLGRIYRETIALRDAEKEEIQTRFPKLPRRVSGYNLDELIKPGPFNLAKLIAGSEGTLGIALALKLKIVKKEQFTALCVIEFDNLFTAMQRIPEMLTFNPLSLEMIDADIINAGRGSAAIKNRLGWLQGDPKAIIVAEFEGSEMHTVEQQLQAFQSFLKTKHIGGAITPLYNPKEMQAVWDLRKAGLGLLLSKRSYSRAIAFIEDISVAPDQLAEFMKEFLDYLETKNKRAGIYGHVGAGCIHIRPYIDLRDADEVELLQQIMKDVARMLLRYRGALSGEHGDGYVRSWLNEEMYGVRLYDAFCRLKQIFDPENLLNPGKIVHSKKMPIEYLRISPTTPKIKIDTFLDFSAEGGIELAADLCNGNGLCRKSEMTMCPSFQATKNECDTTRARAQGLRAIVNGRWPKNELTGDSLKKLLDLCLECKGCKTECPSQVDMAKMKSEFLYQYQSKHGTPLLSKLFGHIGKFYQLVAPFASLVNWMNRTSFMKGLLSKLGIAEKRQLPELASQRFSHWWKKRAIIPSKNGKQIILFNDTYNEFIHPKIGQSAVKVIEALGFGVIVPQWSCCGRPLFSKGLLPDAKKYALQVLKSIQPHYESSYAIIVLEPSCLSMLKEDFFGLLGNTDQETLETLAKVAKLCVNFDSFVLEHIKSETSFLKLMDSPQEVLIHGHCHQKSSMGMVDSVSLLNALPGITASEIPSGCCGMAGSFGYEKEHYELSIQIANLKLLPAVTAATSGTPIIANGTSCRSQVIDNSGRKPLHMAEFLAERMQVN